VAVNIIAVGMTAVLGIAWFAQGGQTPPVTSEVRLQAVLPAAAGWFKGIPVLGPILGDGLFSHNILVYATLALVPAVWWLLYRTRFGLRLRAVGENAHMVDAAGVSVTRMRYAALTLNGLQVTRTRTNKTKVSYDSTPILRKFPELRDYKLDGDTLVEFTINDGIADRMLSDKTVSDDVKEALRAARTESFAKTPSVGIAPAKEGSDA
jgi:hypothetical protein